uniref:(northern house mosquito) hypothetical protein n=1 Tax=Culex pipiens TaxID=7175 RepID=A0A8D8IN28_CULPI
MQLNHPCIAKLATIKGTETEQNKKYVAHRQQRTSQSDSRSRSFLFVFVSFIEQSLATKSVRHHRKTEQNSCSTYHHVVGKQKDREFIQNITYIICCHQTDHDQVVISS